MCARKTSSRLGDHSREQTFFGGIVLVGAAGSLTRNQQRQVSPISVKPGTPLIVTMTGTGDADLYVRFAAAPTLTTYDCRPYGETASESWRLTVPASASQFYLLVNGYTASSYSITANYTAP